MKIQLKEKGQACSNDEAARASVLYISALLGVDNFFFYACATCNNCPSSPPISGNASCVRKVLDLIIFLFSE